MYFDQVLLLLYMRVTLFRFSRELSVVSGRMLKLTNSGEDSASAMDGWRQDFRELRLSFTCFENLYQFPLFSNQQQAVELYVRAREGLDIDGLYKEVAGEIRSSDELLESEVGEKRNKLAELLNNVAFWGLLFSIFLSGLGCVFAVFQAFYPPDERKLKTLAVTWSVASVVVLLTFGSASWLGYLVYRATRQMDLKRTFRDNS